MKNRRYIGEYRYRDILIPDGIPTIVPKDLLTGYRPKWRKNKKPRPGIRLRTIIC